MEVSIELDKKDLLAEVCLASEYVGTKIPGDAEAYRRIALTEEDAAGIVERFFAEAWAEGVLAVLPLVQGEAADEGRHTLVLRVSEAFETGLLPSLRTSFAGAIVYGMLAKWFALANKAEAVAYAEKAASLSAGVRQMALRKRAPTRPVYGD